MALGQKLDQLYFQTYSLNARFAGILRFQSNVRISVDCFRFQIRSEFFDSEPKKFNFDDCGVETGNLLAESSKLNFFKSESNNQNVDLKTKTIK